MFYKILPKYTPKRTKLHHLKIILEEHAPEPPSKRVAAPRAARRFRSCK